jgi:hypothetical protein
MIKYLFTALFHALVCSAHAQSLNSKAIKSSGIEFFSNRNLMSDESKVRFGVKAGANFTNMNFNRIFDPPEDPVASSWKTGILVGLFMEVPVYDKFYIQPEYQYTQAGGEDNTTGKSYKMSYLSLPVLLKYEIIEKLAIVAGPQFDLLIKAEEKFEGSKTVTTHDTEERSISIVGGLTFYPIKSMGLNARYIYGTNNIGLGQRSAVKEFKFDMAEISAAFRF